MKERYRSSTQTMPPGEMLNSKLGAKAGPWAVLVDSDPVAQRNTARRDIGAQLPTHRPEASPRAYGEQARPDARQWCVRHHSRCRAAVLRVVTAIIVAVMTTLVLFGIDYRIRILLWAYSNCSGNVATGPYCHFTQQMDRKCPATFQRSKAVL